MSLFCIIPHVQPHGGANVYLTGDFNGWAGKIPMNRSHNDFTLIVDMPPGRYQYKFIVDNTWCGYGARIDHCPLRATAQCAPVICVLSLL